jgi:hypothetical protein
MGAYFCPDAMDLLDQAVKAGGWRGRGDLLDRLISDFVGEDGRPPDPGGSTGR